MKNIFNTKTGEKLEIVNNNTIPKDWVYINKYQYPIYDTLDNHYKGYVDNSKLTHQHCK